MKSLWWKLRTAFWMRRFLHIPWKFAWESAEAWHESFGCDEATPREAAEEELDAWRQLS